MIRKLARSCYTSSLLITYFILSLRHYCLSVSFRLPFSSRLSHYLSLSSVCLVLSVSLSALFSLFLYLPDQSSKPTPTSAGSGTRSLVSGGALIATTVSFLNWSMPRRSWYRMYASRRSSLSCRSCSPACSISWSSLCSSLSSRRSWAGPAAAAGAGAADGGARSSSSSAESAVTRILFLDSFSMRPMPSSTFVMSYRRRFWRYLTTFEMIFRVLFNIQT